MYLRACLLATLVWTATIAQNFYFSKTADAFRRSENCQMCYQEHCFNMEAARCEYYLWADEMLQGNEDLGTLEIKTEKEDEHVKTKTDVDEALFDLVEKASEETDKECIPYISRYTDCNKENICLGCTTCDCNAEGNWTCSDVQLCRVEKTISVDHRVLVMAMENLMNKDNRPGNGSIKSKRSVTEDPLNLSTNRITFEELSEWWYGGKQLDHEHIHNHDQTTEIEDTATMYDTTTTVGETDNNEKMTTTETGLQTTEATTETQIVTDSDNLAFDEVLNNIGIDNNNYVRRKLPMDLVQNDTNYDIDYMLLDEDNRSIDNHNITDVIPNFMSLLEGLDDGLEGTKNEANKVVIDLLESAKKNNVNIKNVTDDMEMYKSSSGLNSPFENTNDIIEYDAVNIMKRDTSYAENITEPANTTKLTMSSNATEHKCHMNDTILTSLNDLIRDMHRELQELQSVKGNLIHFVKTYTQNVTTEHNITTYDVNPEHVLKNTSRLETNLRRTGRNMLEKYMKQLKRDIYQVLRDIVGIQKYKRAAEFRDDLKVLIRAMKHYISKDGIPGMRLNEIRLNRFRDLRRYWSIYRHSTSPKDNIIKIINILDKELPKSITIDYLSGTARKIVNRVIKHNYIDDFSAIGLRAHDSSYNLTNDLKSVGKQWQKLAMDIENSSPFEKPYTMKQLHFVLVQDINKVKDALVLVDFAHSRRVIPIFRHMESNIVEKISSSLQAINNKITRLLQIQNKISKTPTTRLTRKIIIPTNVVVKDNAIERGERQKKSFLKQIRNLLRGSKKDIADLMNKHVPKAEIVKKIARKKMSELAQKRYNEYEETMKRWQKNLNVNPRRKRSMLDTNGFRARMKNIIPKYLRGKVDGKIDAKKKKNMNISHTNKTTKQKGKAKNVVGKGLTVNKTTQKTSYVTPKLTTPIKPIRLGDY